MAAKLLHSLTDDNLDLQKQIGCMTGILQLFDRPHIIIRPPQNLPPPAISNFNGATLEKGRQSNDEHIQPASTEKIPLKNIQEKQRIFTESSRTSYSSLSRSSSSSSLECNRAIQLESVSFDRITFPEIPLRDSTMSLESSSPHFSRQNRDLRDLVKDSMYREFHGLSAKAKTAEEVVDPVMKYRNSPRLHSEIINGSHDSSLDTKQRMHDDLRESLRVVAKFQEAPWHHKERRELLRTFSYNSRDGSSSLISRDVPRFSYDGREVNRAPFDTQDASKSTLKLKDLPQLSLDGSKVGSMQSLHADSKPNLKSTEKNSVDQFDIKVQNLQQSSGHQARPLGVVAKLMGLEALPHSVPPIATNSTVTKGHPDRDFTNISRPSAGELSATKLLSSSKNLWKEPNSPRWRNTDSSMKPLSRFPIEPAPWKLTDGRRSSQKPQSRTTRAPPAKAEAAFPSVYSEIEKRLKNLEFKQSGKDLRALKQILEAMQAKNFSQPQKEVLGSNFTSHKDQEEKHLRITQETRSVDRRKPQLEARRNTIAARHTESPIVIMKPAASMISLDGLSRVTKLHDSNFVDNKKGLSSGRTVKDLNPNFSPHESAETFANMKNDRTLKATQVSTRSQLLAKHDYPGLGKSSGSISPRMQQKKLELEKSARPPTSPNSSKTRRQPNKQSGESNSPGGRRRPKLSNIRKCGEKLSEETVESINLSFHEHEHSVQSNASVTTSESMIYDSAEKISTVALHEEKSAEFPVEYFSPVSALDNRIHKVDSPSFVRYEVEESMDKQKDSSVFQGSFGDIDILASREYGFTSDINQNKLQNIDNLVKKLRLLNVSHDEAGTDYIASLCENTDPDHRYISEILLASGLLLRDLCSSLLDFQFHPLGHPINPELFLVLEQTKASAVNKDECILEKKNEMMIKGKLRRKLVFDSVNEILGRKFLSAVPSSKPWLRSVKLTRTALSSQKLLRELCSEIEAHQSRKKKWSSEEDDDLWKDAVHTDVMHHESERWIDFDDEISGAVLDVERSIFKDLVNEIVMGEWAGLKTKQADRRRSFSK